MSGFQGIRAQRLYEHVIVQIEKQILLGELVVGDRLPTERELTEQFKVSRTVVREAIKVLQQKGLVRAFPGRGTFIIDSMSQSVQSSLGLMIQIDQPQGLRNLVEVRQLLEPEIAARAAARATQDNINQMQQAVDAMDAAVDDAEVFIEADLTFHLALSKATQNTLIPLLIDPIVDQLRDQRKAIFLVDGGAQRGQYHHKKILDAVVRRDPDAAYEAMQMHLQQVLDDSEAALSRTPEPARK